MATVIARATWRHATRPSHLKLNTNIKGHSLHHGWEPMRSGVHRASPYVAGRLAPTGLYDRDESGAGRRLTGPVLGQNAGRCAAPAHSTSFGPGSPPTRGLSSGAPTLRAASVAGGGPLLVSADAAMATRWPPSLTRWPPPCSDPRRPGPGPSRPLRPHDMSGGGREPRRPALPVVERHESREFEDPASWAGHGSLERCPATPCTALTAACRSTSASGPAASA